MSRRALAISLLVVLPLMISSCAIQPIQPEAVAPVAEQAAAPAPRVLTEEEEAALAVMQQFAAVAGSHPMSPENLEEYMDFYADDATMLMLPGSPFPSQGKQGVRTYFRAHDAEEKLVWDITPLDVSGSTVTVRNLTHGTWTAELPSGALEGTEVYTLRDGKIAEHSWIAAPDSMVEMFDYAAHYGVSQRVTDFPRGYEVLPTALGPWSASTPDASGIEESLSAYADTAALTVLGFPGGTRVYEGKDAIRAAMQEWANAGTTFALEPIATEGLLLTGRATIRNDDTDALGIEPLVATDCYQVRSKLIYSHWRMLAPESVERLLAASGATLPQ